MTNRSNDFKFDKLTITSSDDEELSLPVIPDDEDGTAVAARRLVQMVNGRFPTARADD